MNARQRALLHDIRGIVMVCVAGCAVLASVWLLLNLIMAVAVVLMGVSA